MKVLLVLLPLFHGVFSYWGFPDFTPSENYLSWCSPIKVKDPNKQFTDFFQLKDFNNNKGKGTVKLDTILCYQGKGAPSILLSKYNSPPDEDDLIILFELDYNDKRSYIKTKYQGSSCMKLTTPPLFFSNSVTCVSLELEDYVYKDYGRASYSILTGVQGAGACYEVPKGFISDVKYISFSTDSKDTNQEEKFYINCQSPYYSPPKSGAPTNILVDVEQNQLVKSE